MLRVVNCLVHDHDPALVGLAQAIVRAVLGLGRGMRLPVVAEGAETSAQLAELRQESCAEVQGYLIGHPQPIEAYAGVTGGVSAAAPQSAAA